MRVICIQKSLSVCYNTKRVVPVPIVGEVYEVLDTEIARNKELFYFLEGMPPRIGYEAILFMPLSNMDETTFERNFKKELV